MKNIIRTTITLPEDLFREAKIRAVMDKTSLSDLIRKGLEAQVKFTPQSQAVENLDIIQLSDEKWQEYKKLRLDAVKEDPKAFGLTFEEYSEYPDEFWREQLEQAAKEQDAWMYFAKVEGKLVGMLAANRVNKKRMNHLAHIHSMSVKAEFRSQGIASKLMETVLNKLKAKPELLMAQMGVASSQTEAVELYKKFGFEIVGTRRKVFKFEDKYFDEILMEKEFR